MNVDGKTAQRQPARPVLAIVFGILASALIAVAVGEQGRTIDPLRDASTTGTLWNDFHDWMTQGLAIWGAGPLALRAIGVIAVGLALAWIYRRLRYNEWPTAMALAAIAGLGFNAVTYHAIVNDPTALAIMAACGTLVTVIRRLQSVGDVQAEIGFGLALPLLFASAPTALLILPLAALSALADPAARKDFRAYIAMFLVGVLPAVMVFIGLCLVTGGAYLRGSWQFVTSYAFVLRPIDPAELVPWLIIVAYCIIPYAAVPFAYLFFRDRRRQPWAAIAVIALPLYLAFGWLAFDWPIGVHVPAAVMIATLTAWIAAGRLRPMFRWTLLMMLAVGLVISWTTIPSATILASPGEMLSVGE